MTALDEWHGHVRPGYNVGGLTDLLGDRFTIEHSGPGTGLAVTPVRRSGSDHRSTPSLIRIRALSRPNSTLTADSLDLLGLGPRSGKEKL